MKALISMAFAVTCLGFCVTAIADTMMPTQATTGEGTGTLERDTTGRLMDDAPALDAGSTMTQQRMEEDHNDGRTRDAMKRKNRDWNLDNSKPVKKL